MFLGYSDCVDPGLAAYRVSRSRLKLVLSFVWLIGLRLHDCATFESCCYDITEAESNKAISRDEAAFTSSVSTRTPSLAIAPPPDRSMLLSREEELVPWSRLIITKQFYGGLIFHTTWVTGFVLLGLLTLFASLFRVPQSICRLCIDRLRDIARPLKYRYQRLVATV